MHAPSLPFYRPRPIDLLRCQTIIDALKDGGVVVTSDGPLQLFHSLKVVKCQIADDWIYLKHRACWEAVGWKVVREDSAGTIRFSAGYTPRERDSR